jgi:glutamate-1-semialdehyde 2,1-aminomutase
MRPRCRECHLRGARLLPTVAPMRAQSKPLLLTGRASRAAFARARRWIPGGVNSPVRAFQRLGGQPPVITRGSGPWIIDADGRRYLDCVLSWGPLLHGHAHPTVVRAVDRAARRGLSFGAPTPGEADLAELLCRALPGMEQVRLVSSGTEATMSALRLARAVTGRDLIVKCDGCYHGHADHLLVAAGSGLATGGRPDSEGVPAAFAAATISLPYNDLAAVERVFRQRGRRIAAMIIEPVAGNMGLVLPDPGYLDGLRAITRRHGALLVFDEVMTGFRAAWGGYQRTCAIEPDLTCLGKVIGGGMPVAAYGGKRTVMAHLAPEGGCYQAGTLSGNPVAVAAGLATLRLAQKRGFYERGSRRLTSLLAAFADCGRRHGQPLQLAQAGMMWGYFFSASRVRNFADAQACDLARWRTFTERMLAQGVYLAPSPFEAAFWSSVHTAHEADFFLACADRALAALP